MGNKSQLRCFRQLFGNTKSMVHLWGNYNELREVIELAKKGKIKHQVHKFPLSKVNEAIDLLRAGRIEGRAVIIP